jgi:hypothetical protein
MFLQLPDPDQSVGKPKVSSLAEQFVCLSEVWLGVLIAPCKFLRHPIANAESFRVFVIAILTTYANWLRSGLLLVSNSLLKTRE